MVYEILDLGIIQWRDLFYNARSKQLIEEVLRVIEKERNNEGTTESQELMKTIISSFVDLGLKKLIIDKNKDEPNLLIYEGGFERQFLSQTREYYQKGNHGSQKLLIRKLKVQFFTSLYAEKIKESF